MNNNAKRWVEALRSGEFKQGRGTLCDGTFGDDKYCCLGVACELAAREGLVTRQGSNVVRFIIEERSYTLYLPPEVRDWLGLREFGGTFDIASEARKSLVNENDNGKSFSEIADIIESEPPDLFVS